MFCGLRPCQQDRQLLLHTHCLGAGKAEPTGQGWSWASKVSRPAICCWVSWAGEEHQPPAMPSLLSKHTLGEITDEYSPVLLIQAKSQQRGWVSLYRQAQTQGNFFRNQSDCYSPTDPGVNKMPKPFNFRYYFPISSPQDQEQPTQCQAEAHVLMFPCLPLFPLGLTKLFQGLSPSPSWIHSTPDVPEGSCRRL